ncbi:Fur family transcriptional regulator [Oceaniradius stylonematis]|nr:Fur family transcriptional regulator [Oceaniradius stylonematis]
MNESSQMSARELEHALRDAGVRITRQRSAILRILAEADDHPDANELYSRASALEPTVSLSTVYRTLSILEDKGVVHRLTFEGAPARFETADTPHHDHMIDLETGDVIEFRSDKIEKLQAEIAAELGYDIVYHKLELYGRRKARNQAGRLGA